MKLPFLFCIPFVALHALYNGNPEYPTLIDEGVIFAKDNNFSIDVGYERDWVYDYKLECTNIEDSTFSRASSLSDQAVLGLNVLKTFQVSSSLGAACFEFDQDLRSGDTVSYVTKNTFTFGLGGKILLLEAHNFSLGLDGKYQYANPDIDTVIREGEFIPQKRSATVSVYAWQVGASVSYHVDIFSPYIGVKYLNQKAHFRYLEKGVVSNVDNDFYAKNRNPVGAFVGFSLSSGKDFSVNYESRFIDETAQTLFLDFKF